MAITVKNQKPSASDPHVSIPLRGQLDAFALLRDKIVSPMFTPVGSAPVEIQQDGKDCDLDYIANTLGECLGDSYVPAAEDFMREILRQTTFQYDTSTHLSAAQLFVNQMAAARSMAAPIPNRVQYVPADVSSAARNLLGGRDTSEELTVALSYAYNPQSLGFCFTTAQDFEEFKQWLAAEVASLQSLLPAGTVSAMGQFQKITLAGLTESLALRGDVSQNNDEFSFARTLVSLLIRYSSEQQQAAQAAGTIPPMSVMPFQVDQLVIPTNVILVNADMHARAKASAIRVEWDLLTNASRTIPKVVPNAKVNKLTSYQRHTQKAAAQANRANQRNKKGQQEGRAAKISMRKKAPSTVNIVKDINRVLKKMGEVNRSQNVMRTSKLTYNKANRRDPMNINLPGRVISTKYMPDIHLFIDASGSISTDNYQDTVMMMIRIAKKLNVNLYISFFTTRLTQENLVRTADKSVNQIWKEIQKLPKINGGTSYDQIWSYVTASRERMRRLSIVITDFEWYPPRQRVAHPKNLYYAPCSNMEWSRMKRWANNFVRSMPHIEPRIAQRMMGMFL